MSMRFWEIRHVNYLAIARGSQTSDTGTYRTYRAPTEALSEPVVDSRQTACTCAESAESAVSPDPAYLPLDDAIAADVAAKYSRDEIITRVERLDVSTALPDATPLDRVVAADWRAILAAKKGEK
jgi:hypothetical protein